MRENRKKRSPFMPVDCDSCSYYIVGFDRGRQSVSGSTILRLLRIVSREPNL